MAKRQCFVTIKDHKPDFRTNPKYRLLNPTKSELGKLSKHILQTINTELRNKIKVNQWQNSSEVIEWFKNIPNKKECTFTVFEIQEFYPSITEDLLKKEIHQEVLMLYSIPVNPFYTIMMIHGSKKILVSNSTSQWAAMTALRCAK